MDDGRIVDLYLDRDENAIVETRKKYGHRLECFSKRIVGSAETAEECVSDTYLRVWETVPPHEPRDYFFAFVTKINRDISLNRYRRDHAIKRQAQIVELSNELQQCLKGTDTVEESFDETFLKDCLNAFLSELSGEKRAVFVLRYWYMEEISEIATRFGYSEEKVKSMLFRLRKKLRVRLLAEGYDL